MLRLAILFKHADLIYSRIPLVFLKQRARARKLARKTALKDSDKKTAAAAAVFVCVVLGAQMLDA